MFSPHPKKTTGRGLIGYLGLREWWETELTEAERRQVLVQYQPMGLDSASLVEGEVVSTSQSALHLLWGLVTWFKKPQDYALAMKIIKKGEELVPLADPVDAHFLFQGKIEVAYRNRDEIPGALETAIRACEQQIELAPKVAKKFQRNEGPGLPSHKGYAQLAIIKEKQGQFEEAAQLCAQAQKQGWSGDWSARMDRLEKKTNSRSK